MTATTKRGELTAREIVTGYGQIEIVHEASIAVEPGEIVTIIGPNGAGKSTLIKVLIGLLPAWSGQVELDGQDLTGRPSYECVSRGMGYVPQTDNVFPNLTIRENLEMGGFQREEGIDERIEWIFDLFPDLQLRPGEKAGRLSGGQRQMLAIGRALMLEPVLLILDEPSASLSPALVASVFAKIIEINKLGTSILMVEQNARQALEISHRGYVLATGENRFDGPAGDLLGNPDIQRLYLGE